MDSTPERNVRRGLELDFWSFDVVEAGEARDGIGGALRSAASDCRSSCNLRTVYQSRPNLALLVMNNIPPNLRF
jgi:hypothetical protein